MLEFAQRTKPGSTAKLRQGVCSVEELSRAFRKIPNHIIA